MGFWDGLTGKPPKQVAWDQKWNPLENGPENDKRWTSLASPIQAKSDPYWSSQAGQSALNQEAAGKSQQDAYDLMHATALGGPTAAQAAMQAGTANQIGAIQGMSAGATGGARGAAAAQGTGYGATANAGMMGDANLAMQRNSDMLAGQSMESTMAGQIRDQDQKNLALTNQSNYDKSSNALGWQGLSDQNALNYGKLIQDSYFGQMGFEQDRQRADDTSRWNQNLRDRQNTSGLIGALGGAASYGAKLGAAEPDVNHDGDPTNDTIHSDAHAKEQVRRDAYQEGYEDSHAAFRDLYGIGHAHPEQGYGKSDKPSAATGATSATAAPAPAMTPPKPPTSNPLPAPLTAKQQALADSARAEFGGTLAALGTGSALGAPALGAPALGAPALGAPAMQASGVPEFGGMLGAFGVASPLAVKAYGPTAAAPIGPTAADPAQPYATAPMQPADVPEFGGMIGALDRPSYQFTSDEATKEKVKKDAAADIYSRGVDAAKRADYDTAYRAFTTANGLVPNTHARDAAATVDAKGRKQDALFNDMAKKSAATYYDDGVLYAQGGNYLNASLAFAKANQLSPNVKADTMARAMNDRAAAAQEVQHPLPASAPMPAAPPPPAAPLPSLPPAPAPAPQPMIAMASDERQKQSKGDGSQSFLRALSSGRASYTYKDPSLEPNPSGKPGGRYLGVMAQDLERVPDIGTQLVTDTPTGKKVNVPSMVSALSAGTGALYDQQLALEERLRRLEAKR